MIFAVTLTGCTQSELEYRRNGIGADLYSSDLSKATQNLETYFGYICTQAGIDASKEANGFPVCNYNALKDKSWPIFVQTGFNDIDRRCDGYLAWLEEVRNREAFGNSQLNAIEQLVNAVKVATGDASTSALAIVGAAFGYSRDLFSDYHRFLYNGLESSTIKAIVTERRLKYRSALRDQPIKYKPDAVNILRSYLRICLPFTITMDANTFARALANGDDLPDYTNPEIQRKTLIGTTIATNIPDNPVAPATPGNLDPKGTIGGKKLTALEQAIPLPFGIEIQKRLCVTPARGFFGDQTRAAIELAKRTDPRFLAKTGRKLDGFIRESTQYEAFLGLPLCTNSSQGFVNVFETLTYNRSSLIKALTSDLQTCAETILTRKNATGEALKDKPKNLEIKNTDRFNGDVRNVIRFIKQNHKNPQLKNEASLNEMFQDSAESIKSC